MQSSSGHLGLLIVGVCAGLVCVVTCVAGMRSIPLRVSPVTAPAPSKAKVPDAPVDYWEVRKNVERANCRYLDSLIKADPNNAELYLYRAYNSEDCSADCTRAIALDPNNAEAYFLRGRFEADYDSFSQDIDRAIALNPNYYDALEQRAERDQGEGKNGSRCISDFNRAVKLNPYDNTLVAHRFNAHYDARRWEAALRDYDRATTKCLFTDSGGTMNWSVEMFDLLEAYRKSPAHRKSGHYLKPEELDHALDLIEDGRDADKPADIRSGLKELDAIIGRNPANTDARFLRALGYYMNHELDKSLDDVNYVIARDGLTLLSGRLRAQLLLEKKEYEPALKDIDFVISISPGYAECYRVKAQCFSGLRNTVEQERALLAYCMRARKDLQESRASLSDVSASIFLRRFESRW